MPDILKYSELSIVCLLHHDVISVSNLHVPQVLLGVQYHTYFRPRIFGFRIEDCFLTQCFMELGTHEIDKGTHEACMREGNVCDMYNVVGTQEGTIFLTSGSC